MVKERERIVLIDILNINNMGDIIFINKALTHSVRLGMIV